MKAPTIIILLAGPLVGCFDDVSPSPGFLLTSGEDVRPIGLVVPELRLGVGIETGDFTFSWSGSGNSSSYTLEADLYENFFTASTVYSGPEERYYLGFESDYPQVFYYRLRVERADSISSWSEPVRFP